MHIPLNSFFYIYCFLFDDKQQLANIYSSLSDSKIVDEKLITNKKPTKNTNIYFFFTKEGFHKPLCFVVEH